MLAKRLRSGRYLRYKCLLENCGFSEGMLEMKKYAPIFMTLALLVWAGLIGINPAFAQDVADTPEATIAETSPAPVPETVEIDSVTFPDIPMEEVEQMENIAGTAGIIAGAVGLVIMLVSILFSLLILASWWRIFSKAGVPGWGCLVPIYNLILISKVAGKPAWMFVLLLIPVVNIVILIGLANSFGKGIGFAVGLFLLPVIFYPILAFGGAQHVNFVSEELEKDGDDDSGEGGATVSRATKSQGGGPVVSSKIMTIMSCLALVAVLCFIAVVVLQALEMMYYSADPSVWPLK